MDVSGIAAASVDKAAQQVQSAAQIDVLKRDLDGTRAMAARLLDSVPPPDPAGRGSIVDVYA